jgi:hypothetical protein
VGIEVRPFAWFRSRETAQNSALRVDLQDAPGYGVAHIKDVVRREDKAKRMPWAPLPQELAISVEDLDARILTVAYVDEVAINHDRMGVSTQTICRAQSAKSHSTSVLKRSPTWTGKNLWQIDSISARDCSIMGAMHCMTRLNTRYLANRNKGGRRQDA